MAILVTRREMLALLAAATGCLPAGIQPPTRSAEMAITYIGESQAKPDQIDNFRKFLTNRVEPALRASEGCESCRFFQSAEDPTRFIGIEFWSTKDAHRKAAKSIPPQLIQEFMTLVAAPPKGGYFSTLDA